MNFLAVVIFVAWCNDVCDALQTKTFMANENRQGYDEHLLIKTINKHFPETDIRDKRELSRIISTEKGQAILRNAAVKEMKKKIESRQERSGLDEPLEHESYCNYVWLSWLPWLSCPQNTKAITPLRYFQKVCSEA